MFRFAERPDAADFNTNAMLNSARQEIRRIYEAALPSFAVPEDRIEFPKKVLGKAADHWKGFKGAFAKAQHGRCGYCDLRVVGTQVCDVEHFRPKGMVAILHPEKQGKEADDLSNVSGRKALRTIGTGYWWDAYSWDNYLLSCAICNQAWKKNFFPVDGNPELRDRPSEGVAEIELLYHPFGTEDPADHFRYEPDGTIRGITPMGLATIMTVGLWRGSLVIQRKKQLSLLVRLIMEMLGQSASDELVRSNARTILDLGAEDANTFPGMTRIFWTQVSQMTWVQLEALATQ